jgi:3-phenylpropionate/trans-cinnamate dioxygenase ferredoxin reductase subunit
MLFDSRPKVTVCVAPTGETYPCATEESLLRGMLKLGRKGIPAGCVNGGCGVCKVRIVEGSVTSLGPVSRAHVSAEEERCGITLACRVAPATAVRLEPLGKFEKPFSNRSATTAGPTATLQTTQQQGDM